ncbi:MAG: transglutaminase-like domain-containing protein [Oscillospiraceae bacterium]
MPGLEAALAVNRWCARQMTYETTDTRSMNPITCYYCGLGRCGEESTFGVTALRSVGIPARQIYVPWWSHCDDNHAWVEVYVEGDWHFLGACEPEPILDRGWFNSAASRAMVVCSRIFFDFIGEGLQKEALVQRQGMCLMYNQVSRYAETARLTVSVTDAQGAPLSGAWVRFYVLNMAAPARIAALETGPDGAVTLETGLGSLLVEAEQAGQFAWTTLDISKDAHCVMIPQAKGPEEESWTWDFSAPAAGEKTRRPLTPEQAQEKAEILAAARQTRLARIDSYWSPRYQTGDDSLDRVFRMAGGNAEALWQFYQNTPEAEQPWAKALLLSLASKDWRDAKPEILRAHLTAALALPGKEKAEFIPHVLCPRIGFELLTDWRTPILARLSPAEQDRFRQDPQALWAWVEAQFQEKQCRWHPVLWLQPGAALRLGASDAKGRRLLFVAILRTLVYPPG